LIDWLLSPALALSLLLGLIYTLAVHLFMGLGVRHVVRHWLLSLVGMAVGSLLAARSGSRLPLLGDVHVIEASLAAIGLLVLAGLKARVGAASTVAPPQERA